MDLLKLFTSKGLIERIEVESCANTSKSETNSTFLLKEHQTEAGMDCAKKYIEEERQEAIKSSKAGCSKNEGLDVVSVGTNLQALSEIDDEKLIRIYKTYDFAYRPKSNLSIVDHKDAIMTHVDHHSVVIIEGVTGCGKSTQVPQFILDNCFRSRKHCNIVVTQPRRIAAISIAERVCKERNWPIGSLVGFQVGMFQKTSDDTRLTYVTTGVLLRKLIAAKNMLEYSHIIIDEVHERDQEMDFLLLIIRKFLLTNSRQVRIVLMSATFNTTRFSEYFATPINNGLVPAPIISVSKKRFYSVTTYYLCELQNKLSTKYPEVQYDKPEICHDMMDVCIKLISVFDRLDSCSQYDDEDVNEEKPRHSVLIFLPGIWEIERLHNKLADQNTDVTRWDIVVLHSSITHEEQKRIFIPPPKGYRRIILSTNVAESSLTIDDIKYVIDFCLTKQLVTDPATNFQCLELAWASHANCDQRSGRTGRLMDGRVYRLVPRIFYDALPNEGPPEIIRAPLENIVLNAKLLDMGEPKALLALALDPPDLSNLERTILLLKEVGGLVEEDEGELSKFDGKITALGRIMAALPIEIHIAKLIALGHIFSVLRECIIIGASMAVKSMFSSPFQKRMEAYNAKVRWAGRSSSDCFAFLNAYRVWITERTNNRLKHRASERNWAQRSFIQIKIMHEVDALITELTRRLKSLGIVETVGPKKIVLDAVDRNFVIKVVIAGAFYPNYFARCTSMDDQCMEENQVKMLGGFDPTKTVYLQGWKSDQPGLLYAQNIQEHFKDCIGSQFERIVVKFDASRLYVHFNDSKIYRPWDNDNDVADIPGQVSLSVYKALKKRSLHMPITVPLLNVKEAKNRAEKLGINNTMCDILISRDQPDQQLHGVHPKLPGLCETFIQIAVTDTINPGNFWVYREDETTRRELSEIEHTLNNNTDLLMDLPKKPEIGMLVIAYAAKIITKYSRVVIESFSRINNEDMANVRFVDYGWKGLVLVNSLKTLKTPHPIMKLPAIAIPCTLSNIRPSVKRNMEGAWSKEAIDLMHKLTYKNNLSKGEVYSVVNGIVSMVLMVHFEGKQINVNQTLIDKGLADYCEENYLSRYNYDLRKQSGNLNKSQKTYYENMQHDLSWIVDTYPPPVETMDNQILELKGPFSPLEVQLSSLADAGMGKKVNIEGTSVNSVIVDQDPGDPHDRLLVAGTVAQNPAGTSLTLRNTTLMPNLPGLTALLALIFAPKIELRRNTKGTAYIGALCGLGYNPRTGTALLPEHDMEIRFDTEITIDDLQDINRLRHWMNMGIHTNASETQDAEDEIVQCQKRVEELLRKLIEKPRQSQKEVKVPNFKKWRLYAASLFMNPKKTRLKHTNIYQFHYALMLNDRDEKAETMAEHTAKLRQVAAGDMRLSDNFKVTCELCNEVIYGRMTLRAHLYSSCHREAEKRLGIQRGR